MRRAFEAYQYVAPALLTPLAAWLWWRHYDGNAALAAIALVVPIAYAYIVPGIGTNLLRSDPLRTLPNYVGVNPKVKCDLAQPSP